ncbi:MAG: inner membrane-spanning protein YciB [Parvibaculales bacterium]
MRQFLEDFIPLLVFLLLNAKAATWLGRPAEDGFFIATAGFMVAMLIAMASVFMRGSRPTPMQVTSLILVIFFGTLTLYLQDEKFIKLKPTIIYVFAAIILVLGLTCRISFLQKLIGAALPLSDEGWLILTRRWIYFFIFCAGLNEWARHNLSTDDWVNFKVFAYIPLTFIFMLAQTRLLTRHHLSPDDQDAS